MGGNGNGLTKWEQGVPTPEVFYVAKLKLNYQKIFDNRPNYVTTTKLLSS